MTRKKKEEVIEIPTEETEELLMGDQLKFSKTSGKGKRRIIEQYSLTEELLNIDKTLPTTEQGECSCLGISAMGFPSMNNSNRTVMLTTHMSQFLNLIPDPDIPHSGPEHPLIFTTAENVAGEHSDGYRRAKNDLQVVKIIRKFKGISDKKYVYYVFTYDKKTDTYDVYKRTDAVSLTENFGYMLNNEMIDSLEEGDIISANTTIDKSMSYDEYMNYGYGLNVLTMYSLDPYTSEDAAVISDELHERAQSIEYDDVYIGLNDNDYLMNLHGDDEEFRGIPEIGSVIPGNILAASRAMMHTRELYDFSRQQLKRTQKTDRKYYIDTNMINIVSDIEIYFNHEEMGDSVFDQQFNKYLTSQTKFYTSIQKFCEKIRSSGSKYSRNLDNLYKYAKLQTDRKMKWKKDNAVYSKACVKISIIRKSKLRKGGKVTFRYGNKSVIAKIVPKSAMPYTRDGRRVEIMINLFAIINRTTAMPIAEMLMNSINYQAQKYMATLPTLESKLHFLLDFIYDYNPKQAEKFKKITDSFTTETELVDFLTSTIQEGIYIHEKPMFSERTLFMRLLDIMHKYEWIEKDIMFVNKYGRRITMMNKQFIGKMYMMKLKQTDRRGYSARNVGAIDITGLPTRHYKSRSHLEQTSSTAIRFGEYEDLNFLIGLMPTDLACLHVLYRSSMKGREDMYKAYLKGQKLGDVVDDYYVSIAGQMFKVYMKYLGYHINYINRDDVLMPLDDKEVSPHIFNNKRYYCTNYQFYVLQKEAEIREKVLEEYPCITKTALENEIRERLRKDHSITDVVYDENGELLFDTLESAAEDIYSPEEYVIDQTSDLEEGWDEDVE